LPHEGVFLKFAHDRYRFVAWLREALSSERRQREEAWTKSIAVGGAEFVLKIQEMLGVRGRGRDVVTAGDSFVLRESQEIYGGNFSPQNQPIAPDNGQLWDNYCEISVR
jgi:putative transposase